MILNSYKDPILSIIYKMYIFFMPFSLFKIISKDNILTKYFFFSTSCIFLYIGLLYIVLSRQGKVIIPFLFRKLTTVYCYMTLSSIFMAIILYYPLGNKYGENTFNCILGDIIFYFVVLLNVYFNYYCLSFVVNFKHLKKVIWIDIIILLILGYIQLFTIYGINPFVALYNILSHVFYLYPLTMAMEKGVTFFGSELAAASNLFVVIIPFLFAIILDKKESLKWKKCSMISLLLFLPLFLNTSSSSVYIGLIIIMATVLGLSINNKLYYIILVFGTIIGLGTVIIYGTNLINLINNTINSKIWYIIIGKIFDVSNLSTAMRFSGMSMLVWIFFHFPLTGTGNGIQGFFYENNLQSWAYKSEEVKNILSGASGIPNGGGAFYTAYLSGYGFLGVLMLFWFSKIYIKELRRKKEYLGSFYYLFFIGFSVFNFEAWTVMGIKQNLMVIFLLSIPFVTSGYQDNKYKRVLEV